MTFKNNDQKKAKAPSASYEKTKVAFFDSFEEEDYTAKQRAETSYEKRLRNMEQLRKGLFHNHLLPDNT